MNGETHCILHGLGSQADLVAVPASGALQHDITLAGSGTPLVGGDVMKLDSFVVATSKEMDGAALAINEQRYAKNIVNVVSADEFGTSKPFADARHPGSALAGAVNFVPRSAFERNKPIYSYSVAFLMKDAERAFGRAAAGTGLGAGQS